MAEPYTDADLSREREFVAEGATTHERRMLATVDALKERVRAVEAERSAAEDEGIAGWKAANAAEAERDRLREAWQEWRKLEESLPIGHHKREAAWKRLFWLMEDPE